MRYVGSESSVHLYSDNQPSMNIILWTILCTACSNNRQTSVSQLADTYTWEILHQILPTPFLAAAPKDHVCYWAGYVNCSHI